MFVEEEAGLFGRTPSIWGSSHISPTTPPNVNIDKAYFTTHEQHERQGGGGE